MADESSEGRRYSYTKPKKKTPTYRRATDEDSEGRRASYKPKQTPNAKKGEVRPKRKPKEEKKDRKGWPGVAKQTPLQRETNKAINRRFDMDEREKKRDRIYANLPRPIIKQERPKGGPAPMIEPQVGPVGDLRSRVAHTYRFTPEAYKEMRRTPIRVAPPGGEDKDFEQSVGGYFSDEKPEIYVNSSWGIGSEWPEQVIAHEQAHAQYSRQGLGAEDSRYDLQPPPPTSASDQGDLGEGIPPISASTTTGETLSAPPSSWPSVGAEISLPSQGYPTFKKDFARWSREAALPNGQIGSSMGRVADEEFWNDKAGSEYYQQHKSMWPTERYARTVEFSPNNDRSDWPDYIRPYYKGFLQGMDKLSTGEPTPDHYVPPAQPDADGFFGSPAPYRRNW